MRRGLLSILENGRRLVLIAGLVVESCIMHILLAANGAVTGGIAATSFTVICADVVFHTTSHCSRSIVLWLCSSARSGIGRLLGA